MKISSHIRTSLSDGEAKSFAQLLNEIPELATQSHGADQLRLLLRLDRRFRSIEDGRWILATSVQTSDQRVITTVQHYLDQIPGGGALLNSVAEYVANETGFSHQLIKPIILGNFENNGRLVRNKRKNI